MKFAKLLLTLAALAAGLHHPHAGTTQHHHHHGRYHFNDSAQVTAMPGGQASAVYATGNYTATERQTRRLGHTIWIDVTGYDYAASVLDVEPGDATPAQAGHWAAMRLRYHPRGPARLYMSKSEWGAVKASVYAHVPRRQLRRVHWWVADPTGSAHLVPGSDATQYAWGSSIDQSVARPGF